MTPTAAAIVEAINRHPAKGHEGYDPEEHHEPGGLIAILFNEEMPIREDFLTDRLLGGGPQRLKNVPMEGFGSLPAESSHSTACEGYHPVRRR
ncbi:MAG TPA: hypothetical protein VL403_04940 [Candidatus Kryptonia bacterium]|nr:hypothetical protein [Candidatus Kryptonia bacterium]